MQKRITKDLLTYLPGQALPALAAFITVPIYTRLFLPKEYGNFILAVTITEFLLLATTTGFGQAAVRFYSNFKLKSGLSSYFSIVLTSLGFITLVVVLIGSSILFIFRSLISIDLYPLLWAALVFFVVNAWFATLSDILRGQEKAKWYSFFSIIQAFGSILFSLLFVLFFKTGIIGLIWGQVIGLLLTIPPIFWIINKSIPLNEQHINKTDFKQIWLFALPFTIGNISFWILSSSDRYIINLFHGSFQVGLYAVANKISWRTVQLLVYLFYLVPAPIVSRLWEEHGRKATEEALTSFTRIFFMLIIPAVSGLTVIAAPIFRLLADKAYFNGYTAVGLIACASMAQGLANLASTGCMVANRTKLIAKNQCISAGIGLLLNFSLVPFAGFIGAAISAIIAFSILVILNSRNSRMFVTWYWPWKTLWHVLVATLAMSAVIFFIQFYLNSAIVIWEIILLLLTILIGIFIYFFVLISLKEISPMQISSYLKLNSEKNLKNFEKDKLG